MNVNVVFALLLAACLLCGYATYQENSKPTRFVWLAFCLYFLVCLIGHGLPTL